MYLDHFLCKMCHVFISNISLLIDFYIKTSTHLSACNKLQKLKTSGYPLYAKFDRMRRTGNFSESEYREIMEINQ